jgi:hypothetical protein
MVVVYKYYDPHLEERRMALVSTIKIIPRYIVIQVWNGSQSRILLFDVN